MSRRERGIAAIAAASLVGFALAACAPAAHPVDAGVRIAQPAPTSAPAAGPPVAAVQRFFPATTPTLSAPVLQSSPTVVQVTALGDMFIRRGPDLAFNSVSVLPNGQSAVATGRDVLARWLRIPLPGEASRFGWISLMSDFTQVDGAVEALPEIDPQEWPALAFLRNCTYHELVVRPTGASIPPVYEFPANEIRVNPGRYSIQDVDVDGYPDVSSVDIKEGMTVEILIDGFGEKKKCPPP